MSADEPTRIEPEMKHFGIKRRYNYRSYPEIRILDIGSYCYYCPLGAIPYLSYTLFKYYDVSKK